MTSADNSTKTSEKTNNKIIGLCLILITIVSIFMIVSFIMKAEVYLISVNTYAYDSNNGGIISLGYGDPDISIFKKQGNEYFVMGTGSNDYPFTFMMIPPMKNSLYVAIMSKSFKVDEETTMKSNSDLQSCSNEDIVGDGHKYFICKIDTNSLDIVFFKHYSFTAFLTGDKFP